MNRYAGWLRRRSFWSMSVDSGTTGKRQYQVHDTIGQQTLKHQWGGNVPMKNHPAKFMLSADKKKENYCVEVSLPVPDNRLTEVIPCVSLRHGCSNDKNRRLW